jgi:hypothetical protein
MEKFNTLFKPIVLAFCIIVFAWLVQVTRYEYNIQVSRPGYAFRADRLTGIIQVYSIEHKSWTEFRKR